MLYHKGMLIPDSEPEINLECGLYCKYCQRFCDYRCLLCKYLDEAEIKNIKEVEDYEKQN